MRSLALVHTPGPEKSVRRLSGVLSRVCCSTSGAWGAVLCATRYQMEILWHRNDMIIFLLVCLKEKWFWWMWVWQCEGSMGVPGVL